MTNSIEISHGRGGVGNISADNSEYVDGEIVRIGAEGSHGDGPFGTGRGGEFDLRSPVSLLLLQSGSRHVERAVGRQSTQTPS